MPSEKQLKYWESLKGNQNGFHKGNKFGGHNKGITVPFKKRPKSKGRSVWNKGLKGFQVAWNKGMIGYMSGKDSPSWKGGITKESESARKTFEYKEWRKSIFINYNFTCQKCYKSGGDINAHHINNFSDFPELRTDILNGICLCKKCHRNFHKNYGYKNNTIKQLQEYLCQN